jgi:hypothetical protein
VFDEFVQDLRTHRVGGFQARDVGGELAAVFLDQVLRGGLPGRLQVKIAGGMPSLPSQNSSLRASLLASQDYMDGLLELSERLGAWIEEAQAQGQLNPNLPPIAILYTFFARACDPVLEFLKIGGLYPDEQIVEMVLSTCFDGLAVRQP